MAWYDFSSPALLFSAATEAFYDENNGPSSCFAFAPVDANFRFLIISPSPLEPTRETRVGTIVLCRLQTPHNPPIQRISVDLETLGTTSPLLIMTSTVAPSVLEDRRILLE